MQGIECRRGTAHNACMRRLTVPIILMLAGCVAPSVKRPPAIAPVAPPRPAVTPTPPPLAADWRDWPLTPGQWRYRSTSVGSVAEFGPVGAVPLLTLRCDRGTGRVVLSRPGVPAASMVTIRTTSVSRVLPTQGTEIALAARDPLLDAIGFSRGRFVVEQPGGAALVLPAWAEPMRVTEDCRG